MFLSSLLCLADMWRAQDLTAGLGSEAHEPMEVVEEPHCQEWSVVVEDNNVSSHPQTKKPRRGKKRCRPGQQERWLMKALKQGRQVDELFQ